MKLPSHTKNYVIFVCEGFLSNLSENPTTYFWLYWSVFATPLTQLHVIKSLSWVLATFLRNTSLNKKLRYHCNDSFYLCVFFLRNTGITVTQLKLSLWCITSDANYLKSNRAEGYKEKRLKALNKNNAEIAKKRQKMYLNNRKKALFYE